MRSEFQLINDIKSRYGLTKVGDDCAVLPKDDKTDLLISSDMLVEGVDFRLDWTTPEQLGHKALAVSLSDIAAMGGTPTYAMLSIAVVENLWKGDLLDRFYDGWHAVARKFNVELIGGDVSRTSGPLVIDSTVLGQVPRGGAILRRGAKPGDGIYVTGTLGGAAGGLDTLFRDGLNSTQEAAELLAKQLTPLPQVNLGKLLQEGNLATAAIDVSDGLSSDLLHLCLASQVGAEIGADLLPVHPALRACFPTEKCLELALNGGEDFELLFTADGKNFLLAGIPAVTRIGVITANVGRIELIASHTRSPLEAKGYRHF